MPPVIASASPPDISSMLTSLGVFSLAVAAVVAGVYKGIREVKKGGPETGQQVVAAALIETKTMSELTESNKTVAAVLEDVLEVLRLVERRLDKGFDLSREQRDALKSSTEESHRLRVAITDLHQAIRAKL